MAKKPPGVCSYPGCSQIGGACKKHGAKKKNRLRYQKKSSTQRGYNYRWQRASKEFLRRNPLCVKCNKNGRIEPSTEVDHIVPHRGDPKLFWNQRNWQALCKKCHSQKTNRERRQ